MPEMKILVDGVLETGRVNGIGHLYEKLYDHMQIRPWLVTVPAGLGAGGIYSQLEALAQEFGTTGAIIEFQEDDGDGQSRMIFVGDAHALDANIIARRADRALGGTGVLAKYVVDGYSSGTAAATAPTATTAETALVKVKPITSFFNV